MNIISKKNFILSSFISFSLLCVYLLYTGHQGNLVAAWPIAPTMMLGALVAGSTPMGGGVVAFPVIAYWLSDLTRVAVIFSLGIQSFGMTSASLFLYFNNKENIRWDILKTSIPVASFFALVSIYLKPYYPAENIKLFFSSFWLGCGLILFWVHKKNNFPSTKRSLDRNDFFVLFLVSAVGSLVSDLIGSGADFLLFAFLVFVMKESLKVSTFTSVIQMSFVSIVYTILNYFLRADLTEINQASGFLIWAVPIVIFFAPLGSWILSKIKESFLRKGIYFLIVFQYLTAVIILKFKMNDWIFSLSIIFLTIISFLLFSNKKINKGKTL